MNRKIIALYLLSFFALFSVDAQTFINTAKIEYEVKSNIKKTMGNNSFEELLKENLPTFKTGYFTATFADNKSVYKFDHWDEKTKLPQWMRSSDEDNVWYYDYNTGKANIQKGVWGSKFNIEDSIQNLKWRFTNESREIAGFNCRKAVATIFDSVYVFAFYTDQIVIPGGPVSVNGLPGMILGLTIPRLYTSWIATKVMVNNVDVNAIKPVPSKKNYTFASMQKIIKDNFKDWNPDEEEEKQQKNRAMWGVML